ncbi:Dps DNA-binding ferritin-like protein (oxidative damage protectant) [uncultured Caudovirales phage]|uniref:Dps DNA-binding ferritin-like protein (Oxidative damage protectant) n=1 Tax=uncultured Caudovirales phage TaxID=2100421 RepID=A0A6J5MXB3_9CAUD|nr:Dps DNA-binding ferritin-like protein (oxidative damage protectant) [uncultured Caudovirales phage]
MTTVEALQQIFKDNFVAYFRSHAAHVNIVGRNFASDHKLLQKTYEDLQSQIDVLGELLRTLQEYMPCDIQEVLDESHLDTGAIEGTADELITLGMEDLEHLAKEHRELVGVATEEGEDQIANYAQDRVLALEKHIWMYRSTLE